MALADQLSADSSGTSPTPPDPAGAAPADGPATPRSLWRHRDFVALLSGETISQLGSQITLFALPVIALLVLGANGGQIGALKTLFTLPYFVFPLAVGVFLDRRPRRSAMLVANFGRMLLVFTIPVLAWMRLLTMSQLYVVALVGGTLTVVFEIAYSSYLPALVGRRRLAEANGLLQTGYSAAFLAGPGVAGLLVSAVGAAAALVADAASYLLSFLNIKALRFREPPPAPRVERRRPFAEAWEGVVVMFRIPQIRQIALHATIYNLSFQLIEVAFVVYALTVVRIGPGLFGLAVTIGGVGGLIGALSGARLARRVGFGPAMLAAAAVETVTYLLLPAVHGGKGSLVALFGMTFFLGGCGTGVANVVTSTIRQSLTPDRLMARIGAGYRMMNSGAVPIGAALAGVLVSTIGIRPTLWVAPIGLVASVAPLALTSFRRLRTLPTTAPEPPEPSRAPRRVRAGWRRRWPAALLPARLHTAPGTVKLLYCAQCQDIVRLFAEKRSCRCGGSWGRYLDDATTVQTWPSLSLAIAEADFAQARQVFATAADTYSPGLALRCWVNPATLPDVRFVKPPAPAGPDDAPGTA